MKIIKEHVLIIFNPKIKKKHNVKPNDKKTNSSSSNNLTRKIFNYIK